MWFTVDLIWNIKETGDIYLKYAYLKLWNIKFGLIIELKNFKNIVLPGIVKDWVNVRHEGLTAHQFELIAKAKLLSSEKLGFVAIILSLKIGFYKTTN